MAVVVGLSAGTAAPAAQPGPPVAQIRPVAERYGNAIITDNYRWMETANSPEMSAFMQAQGAFAEAALARIPGRERLRRTIAALASPAVSVAEVTPDGERLFYLKRGPSDDVARLMWRDANGTTEHVLVDPEALQDAHPHSEIGQFAPSPDGAYIAYTLVDQQAAPANPAANAAGADSAVLRVLDVVHGVTLSERIAGARFASVAWDPAGKQFYYTHAETGAATGAESLPQPTAQAQAAPVPNPAPKTALRLDIYMHRLGTSPDQDTLLLSGAHLPFPFRGANVIPRLVVPPSSDYAMAVISDGVSGDIAIYTAPVAQLDHMPAPWQSLASQDDGVVQVASSFSIVFLLTHKDAGRLRVVSEDLADPGFDKARTILPEGDGVITGIAAAQDALFVARRDGVGMHLLRLGYSDSVPQDMRLPFEGTIPRAFGGGAGGLVADPRSPGALFSLEGWTHPLTWLRYDPRLHRVVDTGLVPAFPHDLSAYDTIETTAKAKDGTAIPLSIILRHDTKPDHARPTVIEAYGSYGYAFDPRFMPAALALADEGGVYAIAHVRGGGERGEAWHEAGRLTHKINSVSDLLSCAMALQTAGYTDAAHLTASGKNAGAVAVGMAMILSPAAFRAVAIEAGLTNPMRAADYPDGDSAVAEFGAARNPAQLASLYAMDAVSQVRDGVDYPAVLLNVASVDHSMPPWQSAKLAARLQAANANNRPVLLHVAPDLTGTAAARDAASADRLAFLLWQVGAEGFQPGVASPKPKKAWGFASRHH